MTASPPRTVAVTVDAFERGRGVHHAIASLRPVPRGWERECF
jgi:hypothetical protein